MGVAADGSHQRQKLLHETVSLNQIDNLLIVFNQLGERISSEHVAVEQLAASGGIRTQSMVESEPSQRWDPNRVNGGIRTECNV